MSQTSVKHVEVGTLSHVNYQGWWVLTNAQPESLNLALAAGVRYMGQIHFRQGGEDGSLHTDPQHHEMLRKLGFTQYRRPDQVPWDGKFVYMKNGTFFLAFNAIAHMDLPALIGSYDPVAVLSAGFIYVDGGRVKLFGESLSLDRCPYHVFDPDEPIDTLAITRQLGLPYLAPVATP